ncbi:MAG: hypothetical protein ACOYOH_26445, partial [Paracraurococcus sp.]
KHAASVRSEPGSNSQVHQRDQAEASSRGRLLDQAPLTSLDAIHTPGTTVSQPFAGPHRQHAMRTCFQKTDAIFKDQCQFNRPADI